MEEKSAPQNKKDESEAEGSSGLPLVIFDLDDTLYDTSHRLDPVTPDFTRMTLFPEAKEILAMPSVRKILLTYGQKERQEKKIATLGIKDSFEEIYICSAPEEKFMHLKEILLKHGITDPKRVFVVGDRIDTEIRYGKLLGCTTVHLRFGKHALKTPQDTLEVPDHAIDSLSELASILK